MTALENFLKQIILKKVKGSAYLIPAICDFQIAKALKEEQEQKSPIYVVSKSLLIAFNNLPERKAKILYGKMEKRFTDY